MPNKKLAEVTTTKLIAIHYSKTLEDAAGVLTKYGIRHLPVVNDTGMIVGILSDRDLMRASVPMMGEDGMPVAGRLRFIGGATVMQYMSTALRAVSPDAGVQEAIDLMLKDKVSSCLVVDQGNVVGIITYEDMMELLKDFLSNPKGSLRSTVSSFIANSPLGSVSKILADVGV